MPTRDHAPVSRARRELQSRLRVQHAGRRDGVDADAESVSAPNPRCCARSGCRSSEPTARAIRTSPTTTTASPMARTTRTSLRRETLDGDRRRHDGHHAKVHHRRRPARPPSAPRTSRRSGGRVARHVARRPEVGAQRVSARRRLAADGELPRLPRAVLEHAGDTARPHRRRSVRRVRAPAAASRLRRQRDAEGEHDRADRSPDEEVSGADERGEPMRAACRPYGAAPSR